jgi:hypothetical protein
VRRCGGGLACQSVSAAERQACLGTCTPDRC